MTDRTPHGEPWTPPPAVNDNVVPLKPDPVVNATLDIGIVPHPHEFGGQFIVTLQVYPIPTHKEAQDCAAALRRRLTEIGVAFDEEIEGSAV